LPEIARAGGVARLLEITRYEAWSCLLAGDRVHKEELLDGERQTTCGMAGQPQALIDV